MQCVMEVVSPPALKNHQGILKGISDWEVRVDGLKIKHNEDIPPPIKIDVLVGMLSKNIRTYVSNKRRESHQKQPLKKNMRSCGIRL